VTGLTRSSALLAAGLAGLVATLALPAPAVAEAPGGGAPPETRAGAAGQPGGPDAAGDGSPAQPNAPDEERLRRAIEAWSAVDLEGGDPGDRSGGESGAPGTAATAGAPGASAEADDASDPLAPARALLESPQWVEDRVRAGRPEPATVPPDAMVRPAWQAAAWAGLARALEAVSHHEGARRAWGRAVALGRSDCRAWRGLGRARLRAGDLAGAESALLAGFADCAPAARELGELYLVQRRPALAAAALERAAAAAPGDARAAGLLARARHAAAPGAAPAPSQRWAAWPRPEERDWRGRAESRLRRTAAALPAPLRRAAGRVGAATTTPRGALWTGGLLVACLALLFAARQRGRSGDLSVVLEYPSELRGTFRVTLGRRGGRARRRRDPASLLRGGPAGRLDHPLVSRETRFRRIAPGGWYVVAEGLLQDPESEEVLGECFEERAVRVPRRGAVRVAFDFEPRECPVDVRVQWDRRPVREAGVAVRGRPQSLRYARGGQTRMPLPRGRHVVAAGSGDRVAEHEVEVSSFRPTPVEIDLAGGETVVFKGCPPAVELYLQGDLAGAARELERDGQEREAHLLLARMHRDAGQAQAAARHFEQARCWLEAAALHADAGAFAAAAELYERADDPLRAARMYREAGEWVRAGEAYERAREPDRALECYCEAGEVERRVDLLERRGEPFAAAQVALEHGARSRAIRLLQAVPQADADHLLACRQLAEALAEEGHDDLAAQKLEEVLAQHEGEVEAGLRVRLAELHERAGAVERALEAWEELRRVEPTWPGVATRIEELRKRRSREQSGSGSGAAVTAGAAAGLATTGFLAEQRYELQGEIGRGGMGVVYQARDRRLGRMVALKRLPENLRDHPKAVQLFLREAQASARLSHRNITTIYDADQEDGVFFITMELLQGRPLHHILRQRGRLSGRDVARLGVQIAEGLAYAHGQGVVHRDVKTANLFFTVDRTVKIMDFGLAKMMEEVRRAATVVGGTPYYMAPEQAVGGAIDHRADLYALGVTFFELATGAVPFREGDVTYHHRHTPPPDPRERVADLPDELATLILALLAKSPEDRPDTATSVRDILAPLAR